MSMLLFLRSHPKYDVATAPELIKVEDRRKKKRKKRRKSYSVRNRKYSTVAREVNTAAAAKTYIEETIKQLQAEDLKAKRQRQLNDVMTIMEILDFLDEDEL